MFNPIVSTASGSTLQLHPAQGTDLDDPFIDSGPSGTMAQAQGDAETQASQIPTVTLVCNLII
jgi:hypothetical protein